MQIDQETKHLIEQNKRLKYFGSMFLDSKKVRACHDDNNPVEIPIYTNYGGENGGGFDICPSPLMDIAQYFARELKPIAVCRVTAGFIYNRDNYEK